LQNGVKDKLSLTDAEKIERIAHIIEASAPRRDRRPGRGARYLYIRFFSKRDGVEREIRIDWNLVTGAEYRAMANNQLGLEAIAATRFTLAKGRRSTSQHLEEAIDSLYEGPRRSFDPALQGPRRDEPDQLWETTMDPTKRRLLRVHVEDDVEADAIFTILMGDEVEPRRPSFRTTPGSPEPGRVGRMKSGKKDQRSVNRSSTSRLQSSVI